MSLRRDETARVISEVPAVDQSGADLSLAYTGPVADRLDQLLTRVELLEQRLLEQPQQVSQMILKPEDLLAIIREAKANPPVAVDPNAVPQTFSLNPNTQLMNP